MKRIDFYVQLVLLATLLLSLLASFVELSFVGLRWLSLFSLGLWQPCSAAITALCNMGNVSVSRALMGYWLMLGFAIGVLVWVRLLGLHFQHLAYFFMGIAAVYYLIFTQQFAFYKREKALW